MGFFKIVTRKGSCKVALAKMDSENVESVEESSIIKISTLKLLFNACGTRDKTFEIVFFALYATINIKSFFLFFTDNNLIRLKIYDKL